MALSDTSLSYTITRPGMLLTIKDVVYHMQSVGARKNWVASKKKLQEYVGKSVAVNLEEIDDETIADYIRTNL